MTGPKPPIDALDEQERELARVLRALPGGEPPAALDQKILRAAADAAASSRRPRARWLASVSSLWGIGGAAAAVLALGITWQMIDPSRPDSAQRSQPVPADAPSADATVSVDLGEPSAGPAPQAPATPAQVAVTPAAPARQVLAPATRASAMSPSPAPPPPPPPALAGAAAPSAHEVSAAPTTASNPKLQDSAIDASSVESTSVMTAEQGSKLSDAEASAQAQAEQASGNLARAEAARAQDAQAAAKAMTPAAWLAKVRKLQAENRPGEARDSLQLFHQYYPQYVIPADLAPLLRE